MARTRQPISMIIIIVILSMLVGYAIIFTASGGILMPWRTASDLVIADSVMVGAGDIGDCTKDYAEATAKLLDTIDGVVFTTGDNAYDKGTEKQFRQCYDPTWGRHKARTRPVPGNHEYETSDGDPYYAYFGDKAGPKNRGYYSYTLGTWHIVALNSNIDAKSTSKQYQWLRADLAEHPTTCTLAYWHHPVWSSGQYGYNPQMRDIWNLLAKNGVDVVVNGHEHSYERFAPLNADGEADPLFGMRAFVVGTGGTALRPFQDTHPSSEVRNDEAHGVLKLTLHSTSYDWAFIPIEGQTFRDAGSGTCVLRAAS